MNRSYTGMLRYKTLLDRFEYLKLDGKVAEETFGYSRYLNQALYCSSEWKKFRREVIIRDNGCIFGLEGYDIKSRLIVHHINPITLEQIEARDPMVFSMDNVVCVSDNVHQAIHYGDADLLPQEPIERKPFDTCPWRK